MTHTEIIQQTENWINKVVIGCNFCPFAARAMSRKTVRYIVVEESDPAKIFDLLLQEFLFLDEHEDTETSFLIFPSDLKEFLPYLDLMETAEDFLAEKDYEGIYQLASFHPDYIFAGSDENDAANYTNRSIYPMIHILREESITKALEGFKHPERIPDNNIAFAKEKGLEKMQLLRMSCFGMD